MPLRRLFLLGSAALVSVAALVAIGTVLTGSFGETEGSIFATIAATFVAGSTVVSGVALMERGVSRPLGYAGVLLACIGYVLWTEEIWAGHQSGAYWKLLGVLLAWTLAALVVTTTRLLTRSERLLRTLYPATASAAAGAALVVTVMVLRDNGDGWQLFGVLLILALVGETLTPILGRYQLSATGNARTERPLGTVAGAAVVAVRASGARRLVRVGEHELELADDEMVIVRGAAP